MLRRIIVKARVVVATIEYLYYQLPLASSIQHPNQQEHSGINILSHFYTIYHQPMNQSTTNQQQLINQTTPQLITKLIMSNKDEGVRGRVPTEQYIHDPTR